MATAYGTKLDPYRSKRRRLGVKGLQTFVALLNEPSTIGPGQTLPVILPKLADDDVIVPGSARLAFKIVLNNGTGTADENRTIVNNLGRAIVKKISIKLEGKEIYIFEGADRYLCFRDLWLTDKERSDAAYQGISNANTRRLRIAAGNGDSTIQPDACIARAYGNRFFVPLDFELLTDHMPFHPSGLHGELRFDLTFNDCSQVIVSTNDKTTYQISDATLEFEKVTHRNLAQTIKQQYSTASVILFTHVFLQTTKTLKKSEKTWIIDWNTPVQSLKGVLLLFEDAATTDFKRDSEYFCNPLIQEVNVTVGGVNSQLFDGGMLPHRQWDEITKGFARKGRESSTGLTTFLRTRYGLWLDFRTSDDHTVHGSGRKIDGSIVLQLTNIPEAGHDTIICYVYLLMDGQLNIAGGRMIGKIY